MSERNDNINDKDKLNIEKNEEENKEEESKKDDINSLKTNSKEKTESENENDNLKRTLISPEISPDDINVFEENQRSDDDELNTNMFNLNDENDNYNPNPFISPTMKKNNRRILSKMDRIIIEYNMIKENINKTLSNQKQNLSVNINKKEKFLKKLSEYNLSMLNQLSELSNILNKIVQNQNIYANKRLLYFSAERKQKPKELNQTNVYSSSGLESSEKMLNVYQKEYNKIIKRLEEVKSKDYIIKLKSDINELSQTINVIEKDNRDLHKKQIIKGNLLKNNSTGKVPESTENNLKKKIETYEKMQKVFIKTSKKIEADKEAINSNEEKINILNDKCNNLKKMAKDLYDIKKFEKVDKIKKRSKEKRNEIEKKAKEFEVNIHSIKSNVNKLKIRYIQNKKEIEVIEQEKNNLIEKYQKKKDELMLSAQKLKNYQIINNFKTNDKKDTINANKNNIRVYIPKMKNKNIKLDSFNNNRYIMNRLENKNKNKPIKISNSLNINDYNNNILGHNIKNLINNKNGLVLSGRSPNVALKEKTKFGLNDDLNTSNNDNHNKKLEFKTPSPIKKYDKEENNIISNKKSNLKIHQINSDIRINIIRSNKNDDIKSNNTNEEKSKKYLSPLKFKTINNDEDNKEKIIKPKNKISPISLSKEMILKGLDEQEKENNNLIYSSRNMNKDHFDRRKLLKLNFSLISPKKEGILNRSLNTIPNERKVLDDEIEEDIVIDNSVDNINIKEIKVKKLEEEEKDEKMKINNNENINNDSVEIDENILNPKIDKKDSNSLIGDIIENKDNIDNENNNDNQNEKNDKDNRQNALNTIVYDVRENTPDNNEIIKNEKITKIKNNESIIENGEEEMNKSLEEEHDFDKINDKEEEIEKKKSKESNDTANYVFDDGDNIINADYDKI